MTPIRRYSRGRKLVAMRDVQAGTSRYYHYDHQGTTQCLTDGAGNVTDRFASDAWGVQVKRTGTSINRQWYIGNWGYHQSTLTTRYVRLRWLAPALGAWAAADPEFDPLGYRYVDNAPSSNVDPSGLVKLGFSCRVNPRASAIQGALDCVCALVRRTVTVPREACCSAYAQPATYSAFMDTCPHPRVRAPGTGCCDKQEDLLCRQWSTRESSRRLSAERNYRALLSLCDPSAGPYIRCRTGGYCDDRDICAFVPGLLFGNDIHLCLNNSCGVCLAGLLFHEMGHLIGYDKGSWQDNQPWSAVVECFGSLPCNGVTNSEATHRMETDPGFLLNQGPCGAF